MRPTYSVSLGIQCKMRWRRRPTFHYNPWYSLVAMAMGGFRTIELMTAFD
jgi:hypothetical protein